jgi:uncharacterized membrane protein
MRALTIVCAIGSGLLAGVFFAFSTFVIPALRRISPSTGSAAMQSINRQAPASPLLMVALVGIATTSVVLGIVAVARWGSAAATLALLGAILAIVPLAVTAAYHVPHNDAFGLLDPSEPGIAGAWRHYLAGWVPWNHLRTVTGLAGAVLLTLSALAD